MTTNIVRFPISPQQRRNQWDTAAYDLGECVHDDCDQPAMFYLLHCPGRQPSIKFSTGEHAARMKRTIEEPVGGNLGESAPTPRRAPMVCGDCAMGALAAVIAYGS